MVPRRISISFLKRFTRTGSASMSIEGLKVRLNVIRLSCSVASYLCNLICMVVKNVKVSVFVILFLSYFLSFFFLFAFSLVLSCSSYLFLFISFITFIFSSLSLSLSLSPMFIFFLYCLSFSIYSLLFTSHALTHHSFRGEATLVEGLVGIW